MPASSSNRSKWEFENRLYQWHLDLYLDRLFELLHRTGAKNVLDAGCGEGYVYRAMKKRGYSGKWTGYDISPEAIEYARHESPEVEWQTAGVERLPFPDRSFDLVLSSEVLEHLPDPRSAVSAFRGSSRSAA